MMQERRTRRPLAAVAVACALIAGGVSAQEVRQSAPTACRSRDLTLDVSSFFWITLFGLGPLEQPR